MNRRGLCRLASLVDLARYTKLLPSPHGPMAPKQDQSWSPFEEPLVVVGVVAEDRLGSTLLLEGRQPSNLGDRYDGKGAINHGWI